MKNQYIELVEKWLKDSKSVTHEELSENSANAAVVASKADSAALPTAYAAAAAADYAADAAYAYAAGTGPAQSWVKRYHDLTGE